DMVFSCGCKAEIWATKGLLVKSKGNILNLEIIRDQSGNTLRVSQSRIHNEKLVQTLLKGHSTLSLEDSLSMDYDVKKCQEYKMVSTRPDIASAGVDMLDGFDRGLQRNVQHMEALLTTEAGYVTFTEAWKKKTWLKGLLTKSGHELSLENVESEKDVDVQGRQAESQSQIYKIDLEHVAKVLSMQDDELEPAKLKEVVEVVTTAKLMIKVVTAAATITAATTLITAASSAVRRRKKSKKTKEQMEKEDSRALKRKTESSEEKVAKKQKLDEEVEELKKTSLNKNNKPYYKNIRADGSHQLFMSFLSLLRNFDREDLEVLCSSMEESKKCSRFSKCQKLEIVRVLWSAYHNIYNYTNDLAGREKISIDKIYKTTTTRRIQTIVVFGYILHQNQDQDKDQADKDVSLENVESEKDVDVQGRQAESQSQIYKIDLEHVAKVLSMQDDELEPAKLKEVVEVVTTAKLMIKVVTAAATITAATTLITAASSAVRRRKKSKKTKEQMEKEDSRALKRKTESSKEKVAKKQKLDEEVEELKKTSLNKNNKPYYKNIRADGSHQLFMSFLSLLRNFDREDLEVLCSSMEESKKCSRFSKCQKLEIVRVLWSAYHNIYNYTNDLAGREKISIDKADHMGSSQNKKSYTSSLNGDRDSKVDKQVTDVKGNTISNVPLTPSLITSALVLDDLCVSVRDVSRDSAGSSGEILCVWEATIFKKYYATVSDNFIAIYGTWISNNSKPILLREIHTDYGPVPFRYYHSWFKWDGFDVMVEQAWNSFSHSDTNGLIRVSQDEIRVAVWNYGDNKSFSPDGYTFELFRRYLRFIGSDFCSAVECFFESGFFQREILATRLATVILDLIFDIQLAFVASRQILDGPFILNELLAWCKRKRKQAMIFKVDFAKAYDSAASLIRCAVMQNPFRYLGVMVRDSMSRKLAWVDSVQKLRSRLSKWNVKTLSIGGRLALLKLVLGASPLYNMSIYKVPKGVLKEMEAIRCNFFNGADPAERKITWVSWDKVLASKKNSGLGFSSFHALNRALLLKWVWCFLSQDGSFWYRVIQALYGASFELHHVNQSSIWRSILREMQVLISKGFDFVSHCKKRVGDGHNTRSVRDGVERQQWDDLNSVSGYVTLSASKDRWICDLNGDGVFRVKEQRIKRMASMNTRLNIKKLDGNIAQKHGGLKQVGLKQLGYKQVGFKQLGVKQVGFKQLGSSVKTGVHRVHDEKRVWFEVELQGAQGDCKAEVFQSGLSKVFWANDTTRSTYLVNVSPSSAIRFKKPIDMLGFFGWLASIKQGILEPVKFKCIFLGYHKSIVANKLWMLDDFTSKVEPLGDHTFEVEPQENVNQGDGLQEVQTQDLIDNT
nr:RNA-directed DNA polymerase, eukaryota [Tanacetum cinerariifolium]